MHAQKTNRSGLILILGAMTALSPFSIDMYLPAFPEIARELGTTVGHVSLSLSSYFVGIAFGQLLYGPLLDRFGRKPPLYIGILIYVLTSLACLMSTSADSLIAWRLLQALGGCVAGVASMAMVRDLFPPQESAKVFSLLILILGASPLLAPTAGGYLAAAFGWRSVFIALAIMSTLLLLTIRFLLPESHQADRGVILRPGPIFRNFLAILVEPQFLTYALATSIAFSGLFVYLAGSPTVFMEAYGVDGKTYGWIFASIAAGFILSSQVNLLLLKYWSNRQILRVGLIGQVLVGAVFFLAAWFDLLNLTGVVVMFFLFLCGFGFVNPNATSLALAPFSKNAGSASALLGFLQMGVGAIASTSVGIFEIKTLAPIVSLLGGAVFTALVILEIGRARVPGIASPDLGRG